MVGQLLEIHDPRSVSYGIDAPKSSGRGRACFPRPVRVIGGAARGRRLQAPRGRQTRPTSDFLRETLFDLLGQQVAERNFLDLYAGTGAVGIEALSRGASRAVFVERDRSALARLYRNLEISGFMDRAEVAPLEVLRYLRRAASEGRRFDLIFLDPPYRGVDMVVPLALIVEGGLLAPGALAILERSARSAPLEAPHGIALVREVRHGDSRLDLYRWEGA